MLTDILSDHKHARIIFLIFLLYTVTYFSIWYLSSDEIIHLPCFKSHRNIMNYCSLEICPVKPDSDTGYNLFFSMETLYDSVCYYMV